MRSYKPLPRKLVRDKIPELHQREFSVQITIKWMLHQASQVLEAKLEEEIKEYASATDRRNQLEEIADICEVIDGFLYHKVEIPITLWLTSWWILYSHIEELEEIICIKQQKKILKGGFTKLIMVREEFDAAQHYLL